MKSLKYLSGLLLVALLASCAELPFEQVKVNEGILEGYVEDGMRVFKGVPFAAPPIGDLRWKAPQAAESWEGVREAREYAPAPMQGGNPAGGKSEDCLYLNIWSPAESSKDKLPVLVWIYGGGFSFGSTAEPVYDGSKLAKKGVVMVSIAYRVGQFGFLAHPELSAESEYGSSGNYGLLDQIAGLQWIKDNIAAFGGDPKKVTIFGESAGGISVSMLCASPLAKGLFQGAISQSGGSFGPTRPTSYPGENMKTLENAEKAGVEFMNSLGQTSIEDLRKLDAEALVPKGWGMGGAWPVVDGYVIPDDQFKLYEAGNFNDVPVLIGYNSDEGLSFPTGCTPEEFIRNIHERFGPYAVSLMEAYPVGGDRIQRSARNLMRDAAFGWHTWSWARLQTKVGKAPVYFYYFDQHAQNPEDSTTFDYGSSHGMEVAYVFMNLDPNNPQALDSDLFLSETMGTYWTNFAKYGDPNGETLTKWPVFSNKYPQVMCFGSDAYVDKVPDEDALNVLDSYFVWRRAPEGVAWAD